MQVDQIIHSHDWVRDRERIRTYRIYEDNLGAHHVRYEEYLYTPYSNRGLPVESAQKGSIIDRIV